MLHECSGTAKVEFRVNERLTLSELSEIADDALDHAVWLVGIMTSLSLDEVLQTMKDPLCLPSDQSACEYFQVGQFCAQ